MTSYPVQYTDSIPVIELPARIDSVTSGDLEQNLRELITKSPDILCDFSHNTYISSMGLRVLLSAQKSVKGAGGTIALCTLSPYVQEVFDISGFSRIFSIYPDTSAGISGIKSSGNRQKGE